MHGSVPPSPLCLYKTVYAETENMYYYKHLFYIKLEKLSFILVMKKAVKPTTTKNNTNKARYTFHPPHKYFLSSFYILQPFDIINNKQLEIILAK